MNYATMDLEISKEAARERIESRVSGVRIKTAQDRYEFSSPMGFHLAELSTATLPNGEEGARLKYRTAIISPVAAVARSKAQQIRRAVESHRYRR